jgi:hypothetical protein
MISSILSPFWAIFVTRRKNIIYVMQYLLRFITVFEATTLDHKLFRKILELDWRYSFPKSKKNQMNEGTCTGFILYWDVETVKQLMANFVKVETNVHFCPLVSLRELFSFICMDEPSSQQQGKGRYSDRNFCVKFQKT